MPRPSATQQRQPPPTRPLWLAFGDETGPFERNTDTNFHGVALVLARAEDWPGIAAEQIDGHSLQYRLNRPPEGLELHLPALFPGDECRKEQRRHHVLAAFRYFEKSKQVASGMFGLGDSPADPVLRHLLTSWSWLAGHRQLLGIGVYGPGADSYQRLYRGDDPMAALGTLYGCALAAVYPFLGDNPRLRVLLDGRSENPQTAGVARAGVRPTNTERIGGRQTGGNRAAIDFAENSFWDQLSAWQDDLRLQAAAGQRQDTLALDSDPQAFKQRLRREAVALDDTAWMQNLADLACGMMATLNPANRDNTVRFSLGPQPGANLRFFAIQEWLPCAR